MTVEVRSDQFDLLLALIETARRIITGESAGEDTRRLWLEIADDALDRGAEAS